MTALTIKHSSTFGIWLRGLKDDSTRRRLLLRLRKVSLGNLGDVSPVGAGVMEMREHFGPGWRMYYIQRRSTLIIMLGGGNKTSQAHDIVQAKALAASLKE